MESKLILNIFISLNLLSWVGLISNLYPQQGNTVFAKVISAAIVDDTTVTVPSKYMKGQPYHMATAIFSPQPTKTCDSVINPVSFSIPSLAIYGSYDNVVYTNITLYSRPVNPNSQQTNNKYRMISSASGAFPFIQVSISNWDSANCKVDVFYAGTIQSLDIKKYADFGTLNDRVQTFNVNISGAATTPIVGGITNGRVVVYAYMLVNSATNNITFEDIRSDTSTVVLGLFNSTPAGAVLNLPNTNFPLFVTSPSGTFNIITTGAGTLSGFVDYRIE